ncbi:MAG: phosphoribosylanthranilate isomerase [Bacteroidota bacterium]
MNVKICCITSIEEALLAIRCGATELGLVGPMPSGPGVISESLIAEIAAGVPSEINTFLLTSEVSADRIIAQHSRVKTNTIQIVDHLKYGNYADIYNAIPDIKIVQVIHVIDEASVEEAISVSSQVDYVLLDSGNPNKAVKELGGTGRTHNWKLSKTIVKNSSAPVFLAGGLNPSNIQKAIQEVKPYGVDLCSGVRLDGKLSEMKLTSFFEAIQS